MGTRRGEIARLARQQVVADAYRTYAVLVLEHERLRRTRWRGELGSTWQPEAAAWSTLRFLASVHDPASRSTQVLLEFFGAHAEAEPARVPWHPFREALRAGIDLVADVLVLHGAEGYRPRVVAAVVRQTCECAQILIQYGVAGRGLRERAGYPAVLTTRAPGMRETAPFCHPERSEE